MMSEEKPSPMAEKFDQVVKEGELYRPEQATEYSGEESVLQDFVTGAICEDISNRVGEAVKALGTDDFQWNPELQPMPEYWVSAMYTHGMQHFYPFFDGPQHGEPLEVRRENTPEQQYMLDGLFPLTINPALKKFWETFMGHKPQTGAVIIFHGMVGDTETINVRYEQDHEDPDTFVIAAADWSYFIRGWSDALTSEEALTEMTDWCKHKTGNQDMIQNGHIFNFSRRYITFPLQWFWESEDLGKHPFDKYTVGDFDKIEAIITRLNTQFDNIVADITRLAIPLKDKVKFKDHNLMLAFKGNSELNALVVSLDKVPSKLPEGGYLCGEKQASLEDWVDEGDNVKVIVRKIVKLTRKANSLIAELRNKELPQDAWAFQQFDTALKIRLMTSSHFMKDIYQANPSDIRKEVELVANDVVTKLNERGGNIGLDVTSWTVYQYHDDGSVPTPIVSDGLNFKHSLYNAYTERFMDVLGQYLMNLRNPYIRPYTHRVAADKSDGIPVGAIRALNAVK